MADRTTVARVDYVEVDKAVSAERYVSPGDRLDLTKKPRGMNYAFMREALLGDPDADNIGLQLANGWAYVPSNRHPEIKSTCGPDGASDAVRIDGLVLMERAADRAQAPKSADEQVAEILARNGMFGEVTTTVLRGNPGERPRVHHIEVTRFGAAEELRGPGDGSGWIDVRDPQFEAKRQAYLNACLAKNWSA